VVAAYIATIPRISTDYIEVRAKIGMSKGDILKLLELQKKGTFLNCVDTTKIMKERVDRKIALPSPEAKSENSGFYA
jgi:hypothetical protein